MSGIAPQPTLPPETSLTDAEINFRQEEPPRFFPQNQDSNWGLKRLLFSTQIQTLINQLDLVWAERFPMSSTQFLDEWERLVNLPQNPTNRTIGERRNSILARLRGGPWTRTMRKQIVEGYLSVLAFGDPIQLLPPGVGFDSSGLPLYDEPGTVAAMYRIYEDRQRYRYKVKIDSGHSPDTVSMQRDLVHNQYAGLTLVLDTSTATCYDYKWDTYEMEPNAFWPLNETSGTVATDAYVHAVNGTYTGSYVLNDTALLVTDGTNKAVKLTGGYIDIGLNAWVDNFADNISFECWFKRDVVDANNQYLISKGTGNLGVYIRGSDGKIVMSKVGTADIVASTVAVTDTNIHYLVVQKNGLYVEIWLDGVPVTGTSTNQTLVTNSNHWNIGREVSSAGSVFRGWIAYVTLMSGLKTQSQITRRYNTGKDINRGTVIPF